MERRHFFSGSAWEPLVGYSRAVRADGRIHVSGTTGVGPDGAVVPGGAAAQTRRALEIIRAALRELGSDLVYVVRSRIYTTDISAWQEIGAAHAEMLEGAFPACTMVEVRRLVDPEMLVEIEVEALAPS